MSQAALRPVAPGEQAPVCCGMDLDRRFYSFEEQFGRPAILLLAGSEAVSGLPQTIQAFAACSSAFAARDADVLLIVDDDPRLLWPDGVGAVALRIIDCGTFLSRCGVGTADAVVVVLDRNLRVVLRRPLLNGSQASRWTSGQQDVVPDCLASLDELPREKPCDVGMPAPVIMLPNLLERAVCRDLIDRFEKGPSIEGEVCRVDAEGAVRSVVDHGKKHRRDMLIPPDNDFHRVVATALLDRCAPQIAKAFQVKVAHIDRLLIARYDDSGGWFHRHRDNAAENVAFRQFAISVNLNTDAYKGGHLLFPEYNDHRYSPPTGAGLIFSASILHEATAVTSGCRYVLLTFFHTDEAERRRQDYFARTGSE